jgi:hypothetical protein
MDVACRLRRQVIPFVLSTIRVGDVIKETHNRK